MIGNIFLKTYVLILNAGKIEFLYLKSGMNIQQQIISIIKELLYEQDFLVIPEFGGFVVKSLPARFSISGNKIIPPTKEIGFNVQLKQSDGVLISRLQKKLNIDISSSNNHIKDFSEYCKGVLNSRRRLTLQGIGFFYFDFENNLHFEAEGGNNFLKDSFGLEGITAREIVIEEKKQEVSKEIFVDRKPEPTRQQQTMSSRRKFPGVVAISVFASLILIGTVLLLNPRRTGTFFSSVFNSSEKSIYNPLPYPELKLKSTENNYQNYVADANGIAEVELNKKVNILVKVTESNETKIERKVSSEIKSGKFEIVLGCFSILNNAEKMVKQLEKKNIDAEISGKNQKGMHVVSIAGFDTKDSAIGQLQQIKINYPHSWIRAK